jgi:hypothetical protein
VETEQNVARQHESWADFADWWSPEKAGHDIRKSLEYWKRVAKVEEAGMAKLNEEVPPGSRYSQIPESPCSHPHVR